MIRSELELRCSYETLTKLYKQRDLSAEEKVWADSTRRDVVEGIENSIRNIEKEVAEYIIEKLKLGEVTQSAA